jgi:hypothetical protein
LATVYSGNNGNENKMIELTYCRESQQMRHVIVRIVMWS